MTTLPPDPNNEGVNQGGQPAPEGQTPPPPPGQQPAAQQPQVPPHQPQMPPPQQEGQQAPPAGGYQQPPAGGYQQPAGGGYQPPPPGGYQQPGAYQQPQYGNEAVNMITLNYWLSVFFAWLPALIFYFIEKDKGNQLANVYHRDNLNFSLVRTIVYVATVVIGWIPYIGWLLAILLWIASIVLFVFHIIAAVKAPTNYREGKAPEFIFNIPMVK